MPARMQVRNGEHDALRIMDPRRHFLGLVKQSEIYIYCRPCRRFLRVLDITRHLTANRSPHDRIVSGA